MSLTDSIATEDYFIEVLCVHIDKAYQFALSLTCDKQRAYDVVYQIYEGFSKDLPVPTEDTECVKMIFHEVWRVATEEELVQDKTAHGTNQSVSSVNKKNSGARDYSSGKKEEDIEEGKEEGKEENKEEDKKNKDSKVEDRDQQQAEDFEDSVFSGLDLRQRAVIALNDHFSLSKADVEHILDLNHNTHLVCLASAREQIMSNMGS